MQTALVARLAAGGDVSALAGDRISWVERPQGDALPAVTLTTVNSPLDRTMKDVRRLRRATVQADCWADGYGAARALGEAVIAVLLEPALVADVQFGAADVTGDRDLGEAAQGDFLHRRSIDFTLWYIEGDET